MCCKKKSRENAGALKVNDKSSVQTLSGMSRFAPIKIRRGIRTIFSSGPQFAPKANFPIATPVMSAPMTAKSPLSSSKMSGQPYKPGVFWPLACGSIPSLRTNIPGNVTKAQEEDEASATETLYGLHTWYVGANAHHFSTSTA